MMKREYRVVKRPVGDESIYAIEEVYYNDDGSINMWSASSLGISPHGTSKQELQHDIGDMMFALARPVMVVLDGELVEVGS